MVYGERRRRGGGDPHHPQRPLRRMGCERSPEERMSRVERAGGPPGELEPFRLAKPLRRPDEPLRRHLARHRPPYVKEPRPGRESNGLTRRAHDELGSKLGIGRPGRLVEGPRRPRGIRASPGAGVGRFRAPVKPQRVEVARGPALDAHRGRPGARPRFVPNVGPNLGRNKR